MTTLMRLAPSVTENMIEESRPDACICGSIELMLVMDEDGESGINCLQCKHVGPVGYEAEYIDCVDAWNAQMIHYENLLSEA